MLRDGKTCKRCLLSEVGENDYFRNVYEYIENMPADWKVQDDIYNERLEKCKLCDNLINGMCKLCGCFVETRAIKKVMSCPDVPNMW